jgi:hypothetical protein
MSAVSRSTPSRVQLGYLSAMTHSPPVDGRAQGQRRNPSNQPREHGAHGPLGSASLLSGTRRKGRSTRGLSGLQTEPAEWDATTSGGSHRPRRQCDPGAWEVLPAAAPSRNLIRSPSRPGRNSSRGVPALPERVVTRALLGCRRGEEIQVRFPSMDRGSIIG